MEARGYTLDLYCDNPDHDDKAPWSPTSCHGTYFGETYAEVKRAAKKAGWSYTRDGKQICKYCTGKVVYHADK